MQLVYLKNAAHRIFLRIGTALLALLLICYMGYHIWGRITADVVTETALPVTVESLIQADGYCFRDEMYVTAREPVTGSVIHSAASGARVPVLGEAARIYDRYDADVTNRLGEIEEQISLLRAGQSSTVSLRDLSQLDSDIQKLLTELRRSVEAGDYSAVAPSRRALITAISKRQIVVGKSGSVEDAIAALEDEAASLTKLLGTCREIVTVEKSGYFFPTTDGYETTFTAAAAETMTVSAFRSLIAASPRPADNRTVGKLTETYVWYVACTVTPDVAGRFSTGRVYDVAFPYNQNIRLPLTLSRIVTEDGEKDAVLVFRSESMPNDFSYDRTQPIEIVETDYTGFSIPTSAIRVLDGVRGVYILDGSTVRFRAVSILATVDDSVIVDPTPEKTTDKFPYLARNDNVITSGKGLYDGRILT